MDCRLILSSGLITARALLKQASADVTLSSFWQSTGVAVHALNIRNVVVTGKAGSAGKSWFADMDFLGIEQVCLLIGTDAMEFSSLIHAEVLERARLLNDATVTLYDWMADDVRDGRNLIATDRNGVEIWRAKPVLFGDSLREDCFTAIRWDGVNLTAYTWSGYKVSVDPDSGDVTVLEFTK